MSVENIFFFLFILPMLNIFFVYPISRTIINLSTTSILMIFQTINYILSICEQKLYDCEVYFQNKSQASQSNNKEFFESLWFTMPYSTKIFKSIFFLPRAIINMFFIGMHYSFSMFNTIVASTVFSWIHSLEKTIKSLREILNFPPLIKLFLKFFGEIKSLILKTRRIFKFEEQVMSKNNDNLEFQLTELEDDREVKLKEFLTNLLGKDPLECQDHYLKSLIAFFDEDANDTLEIKKQFNLASEKFISKYLITNNILGLILLRSYQTIHNLFKYYLIAVFYDLRLFETLNKICTNNRFIPTRIIEESKLLYPKESIVSQNTGHEISEIKITAIKALHNLLDTFIACIQLILSPIKLLNSNIIAYCIKEICEKPKLISNIGTALHFAKLFFCFTISFLLILLAFCIGFEPFTLHGCILNEKNDLEKTKTAKALYTIKIYFSEYSDFIFDKGLLISVLYLSKPIISTVSNLVIEIICLPFKLVTATFETLYHRFFQPHDDDISRTYHSKCKLYFGQAETRAATQFNKTFYAQLEEEYSLLEEKGLNDHFLYPDSSAQGAEI